MSIRLRLEWSAAASADLLAIVDHLADDSPAAAQALKDEIERKANLLTAHPLLYAKSQRAQGYRQLTVRANYMLFYRVLPNEHAPQVIDVTAVIHARRNWP